MQPLFKNNLNYNKMLTTQHETIINAQQPKLTKDGSHWCLLKGKDLQTGIAGFGETIEEAAKAFCKAVINTHNSHEYDTQIDDETMD